MLAMNSVTARSERTLTLGDRFGWICSNLSESAVNVEDRSINRGEVRDV
jgi:hypothetical protein